MIICYIDESGTPEIPGTTSHYVLAGFAMPADKWKKCESEIEKIKKKYQISDAEIHAGWMVKPYAEQKKITNFESLSTADRKREVEKQRNTELLRLKSNPRLSKQYHNTKKFYTKSKQYIHLTYDERKAFLIELSKLIGSWKFCRLFVECIDKIHFDPAKSSMTVDQQAFGQVVSRFEQYLKIYSTTSKIKQFGLLVHDNNQTVAKKHTELMKNFHKVGTFWTSINNIIETPMFVDSELTSMVQIADVCSYAFRRYVENKETYLLDEIIKIADTKNGKTVGVRHFTDSTCKCQLCSLH